MGIDTITQLFALAQWVACHSSAFGMTPNQLVRIEVWRVAWQEVQSQTPLRAGYVLLDHSFLVCRQPVYHQVHRPLPLAHEVRKQSHEQLTCQTALIGLEPERPFCIDR